MAGEEKVVSERPISERPIGRLRGTSTQVFTGQVRAWSVLNVLGSQKDLREG